MDGDIDYLANKLRESKARGANQFYRKFLIRLFFEGFAKEDTERSQEVNQLLGKVPYLNGGLFLPHQLELAHGENINITDAAFEQLFAFFDRYSWHLDYRPLRADNEINPDILGYIFEKYVNQKQMGAYYTKEDITDYICKNTIIPFLFDKLESMRYDELHPFPMEDIEPYIYEAVKQEDYLLTETEREYQARRKRYQQIKQDFAAGKISSINDLITYNLNIRKFAEDRARNIKDPVTLRAFYFHCLTKVTVLDPAVGSGAFLFAALNMLEPLYEICLDKMEELGGTKYPDFAEELARIRRHPNRKYFVLKSIIVNNLFGVDIMEEAVEICKLRLFLKLVSQVSDVDKIEPLPDIDFNIRAGNSLVGYVNEEEIKKAKATQLDLSGALKGIEDRIENADCALKAFRDLQTRLDIRASEVAKAKAEIKAKLAEIQKELDRDLAAFYGARDVKQFVKTHQPFHWFVEFYGIMKNGGFDVIIGNPPYVEYSKVRNTYTINNSKCLEAGNLYAYIIERSLNIERSYSRLGMIIQLSAFCTPRMKPFQDVLFGSTDHIHLSFFDDRPGKLFDGLEHIRVAIVLVRKGTGSPKVATTRYIKFSTEARPFLFDSIVMQANDRPRHGSSVLKVSTATENEIVRKLWSMKHTLSDYLQEAENKNFVYYGYGFGYWGKILNFKSYFRGEKVKASTGDKYIYCQKQLDRDVVTAIMNSSLFYWFYVNYSDGHNFTKHVIGSFPFEIPDPIITNELKELCSRLMVDLKKNTRRKTAYYAATGHIEYEEFYPKLSKSIIDEIDYVLAKRYGFTDEELDFIINYDIKYRMGKESEEDNNGD
ncbi:MAG: Eco57I restriction-modification methylase domain-containing protein [Dehalococcoidia bacterium]|nr:Eco57I restriction-modification methylase domain-containing protein [Dehalococcoidia bacterium]